MSSFKKKIVLIGNYLPDKQKSMQLFLSMFLEAYKERDISVEVWRPPIFFAKNVQSTSRGFGKCLAYLDKYLLFPMIILYKRILLQYKDQEIVVHICDHSNAPYLYFLPRLNTVITCHDVLAIRGAMGFKDAHCTASFTGKILQQWILGNLIKAHKIAFVSFYTQQQFLGLRELKQKSVITSQILQPIIYNGFNADFYVLGDQESAAIFSKYHVAINQPYLLHVGSALPRKNRQFLVNVMVELKNSWNGVLCFAGQKIESELNELIVKNGLQNRVISIERPSHELLVALYNRCEAFVFPSLSEGFGWPLIEAQACGAPVITSNYEPMLEVCGGAAIHVDPTDVGSFTTAIISLKNNGLRKSLVESGFKNSIRFNKQQVVESYLSLYQI